MNTNDEGMMCVGMINKSNNKGSNNLEQKEQCQDRWIAVLGGGYTSLGMPTQGPSGLTRSQQYLYIAVHTGSAKAIRYGGRVEETQREAGE